MRGREIQRQTTDTDREIEKQRDWQADSGGQTDWLNDLQTYTQAYRHTETGTET